MSELKETNLSELTLLKGVRQSCLSPKNIKKNCLKMDPGEVFSDQGSTNTESTSEVKGKHRKRKKGKNISSDTDEEQIFKLKKDLESENERNQKLHSILNEVMKDRESMKIKIKELENEIKKLKNNEITDQPNNKHVNEDLTHTDIENDVTKNKTSQQNNNLNTDWAAEASEGFGMANTRRKPRRNVTVRVINDINTEEKMDASNLNVEMAPSCSDETQKDSQTNINTLDKPGKTSPPPIFKIYNVNIKEISNKLNNLLGHNLFTFNVINKNLTSLKLSKSEDHSKVKEFLIENNYSFFTYTPKEEKPISLLIKKLTGAFEKEDILNYYKERENELHIKILNIIELKGSNWIIQLSRDSDIKAFMRQKFILQCGVSIESYKREDLIQCRNCQRAGHIAGNCNMPYRCVKCDQPHGPKECQIPPKEQNNVEQIITDPITGKVVKQIGKPVYCVNCKEYGHVASYKQCPSRLKILEKIRGKSISNTPTNKKNYNPMIVNSSISYSSVTKAHNNVSNNGSNNMQSNAFQVFNEDCKKYIGKDMLTILKKIDIYAKNRINLKTDEERAQAIFNLLLELKQ